jgi:predicted enzyme related to lactoylglutathione lyase
LPSLRDDIASVEPAATAPTGELGYYTFAAPDVDRAAAFYGALFGWDFQPAEPMSTMPDRRYRHIANTTVAMGIHEDTSQVGSQLYYRVDDLDAMVAKVRELGGEVLEVADYESGGNARCRDDQGVEFELWKPAPGY